MATAGTMPLLSALTRRRLRASNPTAVGLLVAANAVPLVGVLFLGWDLMTIIVIYWLENGVVGIFAALRILTARGGLAGAGDVGPGPASPAVRASRVVAGAARFVLVPFFLVHYGAFWAGHGLFVWVALPAWIGGRAGAGDVPLDTLVVAGFALVVSHGASFVLNWWRGGEYRTATPTAEMSAPYGRVIVLHLTIIFGAMAVAVLGAPVWALVVMVALKTYLDLVGHLRDRERAILRDPGRPPDPVASPA